MPLSWLNRSKFRIGHYKNFVAWTHPEASVWFNVIQAGYVTSKFQLILLKHHYWTKKHLAYICWQDFVLLVSKTITCSNVMTQMDMCPKMKYKYVSPGSLPLFHFTTECYLGIKAGNWSIKMRNQSTTLTNIIAILQKSCHCCDPTPHHNNKSSIWAAGQVSS